MGEAPRFLRITGSRADVAWSPRESVAPAYLYRPGDLLVAPDAEPLVHDALRKLGVRTGPAATARTGLARLALASDVDVPDLLAELEDRAPDVAGLVSPNHWFVSAPYRHWGPSDEPAVPPRGARVEVAKNGGSGARVAVVDTGFLADGFRHRWLAEGVHVDADDVENPDSDGDGYIDFDAGHGTFVAGCVRQVAPEAALSVEQVLDRHGLVTEHALSEQVLEALRDEPHVLNLSFGCYTRDGREPLGLSVWERRLRQQDDVVVAAAGNDATDDRFYPAALPWVLAVGATDAGGARRAAFSNYGDWVDCCARGEGLLNAYGRGRYRTESGEVRTFDGLAVWSGTSFAAPLVAGAIAARMEGGRFTAAEARDRVLAEAGPVVAGVGPYVAT